MTKIFLLFDMDGVLITSGGYQQALKSSIRRIGRSIGVAQAEISNQQIAQFEALSVTNEWDTLAICTSLMLIEVWAIDGSVRLSTNLSPNRIKVLVKKPYFQAFLDRFTKVGALPGQSAYKKILRENPWLKPEQNSHLKEILYNCREMYQSLTLPSHQETVLGSKTFKSCYGLEPQLDIESALLNYDKPAISTDQNARLHKWLEHESHYAGILTNRPDSTPPNYLSAPEAEMGAKLVGMEGFPLMGSGKLSWFAETQASLPNHTLLKPNPVHALALIQICLGQSPPTAIHNACLLWQGRSSKTQWQILQGAQVIIFEDSLKGLQSGISAKSLLREMGIDISLELIGVTENAIKKKALLGVANEIIPSVNQYQWPD